MLLYLVRHAKTSSNKKIIYAGRTNEAVSADTGEAIDHLTNFLLSCEIRHIYSSPLLRTRQTAEEFSRRSGLPVTIVPEITEMDVGPWSGLTADQVRARFPREWATWRERPFEFAVEGFESLRDVQLRAFSWLCSLPVSSAPAAAFTHEALIKAVLSALSEDGDAHYRKVDIRNCSVHLIESSCVDKAIEWVLRFENLFAGA
jgi:broad specificity phosphatase PhoE